MLPFLSEQESQRNNGELFEETATVGSFIGANRNETFEAIFENAVDRLRAVHKKHGIGGLLDEDVLQPGSMIMADFKEDLLGKLADDVANLGTGSGFMEDADASDIGHAATLYDQVSQLFDNKVDNLYTEAANAGSLLPIKTVDFPIMVKNQVQQSYKDIVNEEISPSLTVKKQIEHHWVYDKKDPTKKWEYPQCLYNDEYKQIIEAGKGTKLKEDPVDLPIFEYNIIEKLTDAAIPHRERIVFDISIEKVETKDGDVLTLRVPMQVNLADGSWLGGRIHEKFEKAITDGSGGTETVEVNDCLTGIMDWTNGTTSLNSASGDIVKVYFTGRLSNEHNENTVRHSYTREDREFHIGEGCKVDAAYTLEELTEHKVLLNMDLYQKSYNDLGQLITDLEDSDGYDFLDNEFAKYDGLELDPLQWNPIIRKTSFNCDSTIATVALPSEYIAKELKFKIDRFLIDIADDTKLDDIRFVLWGNPRYISLIEPSVKWIFKSGQRLGGVKLNYSYGVMTSGDVSVFVVASKKVNARTHKTLRLLPFGSNTETITFRRYKFSTDVITSKESAYKDTEHVGGSMTYVFGTSRYKDVSIQGIQAEIAFENADFISSLVD